MTIRAKSLQEERIPKRIPKRISNQSTSLQKRMEFLEFKGLFDCSNKHYPENPKKGDFHICGFSRNKAQHVIPDGQSFKYGDYMVFNGTTWDRVN